MNAQFPSMSYPLNPTGRSVSQNPTQNNEQSRATEQDKRQTFNMPFIPIMPFRIQSPFPNQMPATIPPVFRMPDQQSQFPENQQNLADPMNGVQATLVYYQNGFKQLYEANAYLQMALEQRTMALEQRTMALEQRTLENSRLKHMFEEAYSEKLKLAHYYQNLLTQQQTNGIYPPGVPETSQNHSSMPAKNQKIQQKSKHSEKQPKILKSRKITTPGKKKLSPEENSKKKQDSTKKQQIKNITLEKQEETQEKKIMSNLQQSQEEQVKIPHEEFKYYHRTFETKEAMMEYKNKLRGVKQLNENGKEVIKKPEQRRVRNRNYEYIQLDNAPKALKKLKEEYMMKKQQYFNAKESSKTLGIQEQNNENTKKSKSKSKNKKKSQTQSQQQELENKNSSKNKKKSDSKKRKQLVTQPKQFLSDAREQSESSQQKEEIPQYSILKPLIQQTNKGQLPNKVDVSFSSQQDSIKSAKQQIKKEEKSIEILGSLIVEEEQKSEHQNVSSVPQPIIQQQNLTKQGIKQSTSKEAIQKQKQGQKSNQKNSNPEVDQNLNSGSGAAHPAKQDNELQKSDVQNQPENKQPLSQQMQFISFKQAVSDKKPQLDQDASQMINQAILHNQAFPLPVPQKQVQEKAVIVHYDHEDKDRFEMKDAKIKKRKQKVKIPCYKEDAFMIIKNWRDYQRLTGYNIVFQGVFQSDQQVKKEFNKTKYDQDFTYSIPKKQKKQRKARGKYKKRQKKVVKADKQESEDQVAKKHIKQDEDYQEEQGEIIENSESEAKYQQKADSGASI